MQTSQCQPVHACCEFYIYYECAIMCYYVTWWSVMKQSEICNIYIYILLRLHAAAPEYDTHRTSPNFTILVLQSIYFE